MDGVNCHKSPIHPILTLEELVRIIGAFHLRALHASSISLVHPPLLLSPYFASMGIFLQNLLPKSHFLLAMQY